MPSMWEDDGSEQSWSLDLLPLEERGPGSIQPDAWAALWEQAQALSRTKIMRRVSADYPRRADTGEVVIHQLLIFRMEQRADGSWVGIPVRWLR